MTLHRRNQRYSAAYAARQLAAAQATYAAWEALVPKGWRERADRHQALQTWGAAVDRWERVLRPVEVERYRLPF